MNSAIILLRNVSVVFFFYDSLPCSFEVKLKRERVVDGDGAGFVLGADTYSSAPSITPPPLPFPLTLIKSASLPWLPKIIGVGFGCHLLEMSPVSIFF